MTHLKTSPLQQVSTNPQSGGFHGEHSDFAGDGLMQINAEEREFCKIRELTLKPHTEMSTMRYLYGCLAIALLATPTKAASASEQRGFVFAKTNCARCHAIDRFSPSPLKIAPPFRDLHRRYKVETLAEAFAEGIYTGHPTMPVFQLDPDQINDLLAFMKSLEQRSMQ